MNDLIRWILADFWRFVGALILLYAVGEILVEVVKAIRGCAS